MNLLAKVRQHWHPLHHARKWPWFQKLLMKWDPMIAMHLPGYRKPIYVRLFAHASLWITRKGDEEGVLRTFEKWMESPEGKKGCWDVGTNIGVFSFTYANAYPGCKLVSFEPDQRNLECLRRTMSVWRLAAHTLVPCAVSDHSGQATFTTDRLSGATGTLVQGDGTFNQVHYSVKGQTETVDLVRLDDFYQPDVPPGLVKIDVEGSEVSVLRGATRLLSEASPVLLFESFTQGEDCRLLLSSYDYSLFDSDRCTLATNLTTNFLALVLDKSSSELIHLLGKIGYPL